MELCFFTFVFGDWVGDSKLVLLVFGFYLVFLSIVFFVKYKDKVNVKLSVIDKLVIYSLVFLGREFKYFVII